MMNRNTILTPCFLDQPLPGLDELQRPGWIINQLPLPGYQLIKRIAVLQAALARYVEEALAEEGFPVSIAGDCCSSLGVLAGLRRSGIDPTLVWFDAHGDFNTWETTPSGFLGGMPLAMLAGLGEQTILEELDLEPLAQEQITLSDARDLDPGERELVNSSGITHYDDVSKLLDHRFPDRPIWVHFDTDLIDPVEVPAQNYPAPGGPNRQELGRVFEYLRSTGLIRAVSVSSWAPDLDLDGRSRDVSMELLDLLCPPAESN